MAKLLSCAAVLVGVTTLVCVIIPYLSIPSSKPNQKKKSILKLIGNTDLIEIKSLSKVLNCTVLGKTEFLNYGGSPKDRVALGIITQAEQEGLLVKGSTIIEGTVGSTGISLTLIAKAKGYNAHIIMPDDVAIEKSRLLETLGATVEKVKLCSIIDPNHFVNLARKKAEEMNAINPKSAFFCNQFENMANYNVHYSTTGPEILEQCPEIDVFCCGAGTGGTISGIAAFLKPKVKGLKVFLADPEGSGLLNKVKYNTLFSSTEKEGSRKRHQIDTIVEGVGLTRLTSNFSKGLEYIDDAIRVTDQEAVEMSRFLLRSEGLFLGSSSAVNLVAALKIGRKLGEGFTIVTLLCDSGSRHLTKFYNDEFLLSRGLTLDSNLLDLSPY